MSGVKGWRTAYQGKEERQRRQKYFADKIQGMVSLYPPVKD